VDAFHAIVSDVSVAPACRWPSGTEGEVVSATGQAAVDIDPEAALRFETLPAAS
jgi:hypothetical protein